MAAETQKAGFTIDVDIPCSQCGYNLRGLEAGGRCPECGGEIAVSVDRWTRCRLGLTGIHPYWLASVQRGLGLILVSNALLLLVACLPEFNRRGQLVGNRTWLLCISSCLWVMAHWGAWKLAAPNPERRGLMLTWPWRWACRLTIAISVLGPAWLYLRPSMELAFDLRLPSWTTSIGIWSFIASVACIFHVLAVLSACASYDRSSGLKWVIRGLQFIMPILLVLLFVPQSSAFHPEASLEGLLAFPVPIVGIPLLMRVVILESMPFHGELALLLAVLGHVLCSVLGFGLVFAGFMTVRDARRGIAVPSEVSGRD